MVAEAIERMLAPMHLLSIGPSTAIRYLDNLWSLRRMFSHSCLGGGTLIFAPPGIGWLESVQYFQDRTNGLCSFGTGVIDPEFRAHLNSEQADAFVVSAETKHAWVAQLKKFNFVSVRGDESQRLLHEAGMTNVEVIGDPALYFADAHPQTQRRKMIGVNISSFSDFWGNSQALVIEELTKVIQELQSRGYSVCLFPTQPADEILSKEIVSRLGLAGVSIRSNFDTPEEFIESMRELTLFVGTKLHSVVCAFCAYTPAIMIGYQPKCYDFMKTMGFDKFFVRSDRVDADTVVGLVDELLVDLPGIQRRQWEVVQLYRNRMLDFRDRVLASIGVSPTFDCSNARDKVS